MPLPHLAPAAALVNILGFNCYMHDAAAAVLVDGEVSCAVAEERFARRKHVGDFPEQAIRHCLTDAGVRAGDLDVVTFFYRPWRGFLRRGLRALGNLSQAATVSAGQAGAWNRFRTADRTFREVLGLTASDGPEFRFVEHHLAHAASAFYCCPFDEAAILSVDGAGEWTTTLLARGHGSGIEKIEEIGLPHSLGKVYTALTQYLGFRPHGGEGKVMGLAPYGDPARFREAFRRLVRLSDDGSFQVDTSYLHVQVSHLQDEEGGARRYGERLIEALGPAREPESAIDDRHQDVAAALQERVEEAIVHLARELHRRTGLRRLCMAGGVALNSVANGRVIRETEFEEIFIQPAAADDGTSLGGALHAWMEGGGRRPEPMDHAYLGPRYPESACRRALADADLVAVEGRIPERVASLLADEKIVALYQGRAEFGPRALGNRSILADPRRAEMKDILNARVKKRESFRPFAPAVLAERRHEFFCGGHPSPYMLLVEEVRPDKRAEVPAITHVDGTARVQDVRRETNPLYYDIIDAFGRATGVPVLLNTSYNVRGEPIINTPEEAVRGFLSMDLDALVLGDRLVTKPGTTPVG